jgi:hypothetical protein
MHVFLHINKPLDWQIAIKRALFKYFTRETYAAPLKRIATFFLWQFLLRKHRPKEGAAVYAC